MIVASLLEKLNDRADGVGPFLGWVGDVPVVDVVGEPGENPVFIHRIDFNNEARTFFV